VVGGPPIRIVVNSEPLAHAAGGDTSVAIMSLETHTASRVILATPRAIFRAFVDPEVLANWRVPAGMSACLSNFDPRIGGGYRMTLTRVADAKGRTEAKRYVVSVRFLELLPDEAIVEAVAFVGDDPALQGAMTLTTALRPVADGTRISVTVENVPSGITEADPRQRMQAALKNLAALLE